MEFSFREWLIFLGIIVIVGVLLDGYRRVRSGSRGRLKMSIDKSLKVPENDKMDYFNGELPNGGSRAVNRSTDDAPMYVDENEQDAPIPAFDVAHELRPDPLFADDIEPEISADFDAEINEATAADVSVTDDTAQPEADIAAQVLPQVNAKTDAPSQSAPARKPSVPQTPVQEKPAKQQAVEEVIVMNVFSRDEKGFNGADLMRVILACGMRYGDMDIFHRSEGGDGGVDQFSMANIVKPGTFDLDEMDDFYTPGVSFFLSLPGPKNSLKALEYMHETAQCVVKNLNGELKDEMHSAMTGQTIEHARQTIRDFERRQLSLLR